MKNLFTLLSFLLALPLATHAQIGMGGQPHSSAVLDLKSPANDRAFYPPRLTTAQRLAIVNPQAGAFVFDLDKGAFYYHDGQNWVPLAPTSPNYLPPIDRTASDGTEYAGFGTSVAISGDYAIVGAPNSPVSSNLTQGAAYIFIRSGNSWTQQAKLTASDGAASDQFGYSVAISGDYAVVGANNDAIGSNNGQGSAYIFMRSGDSWIQQAKLTASDGAASDNFGYSVSISGSYAMIGARGDDIGSNVDQGSAYVFMRSNTSWNQQAKLLAGDGTANDFFGTSVAISNAYMLAGASNGGGPSSATQGAAYVFFRSGSTYVEQAKLVANDGTTGDAFGISVATTGDYAVVGANYSSPGSVNDAGAAYVFIRSGSSWAQQVKLTKSDPAVGDFLGTSVALSGNYALIGASGDNVFQGSATLFVRSGTLWSQVRTVTDFSASGTSNGKSVGLSNGTFIIGGPGFKFSQGKVGFGTID
ncbi:FG-GAP repeat protein [Rudanella lutea]|uniref:FG-GAP repeat protein n=1 Tax=Rudanella lutea TaxID=451374 RepID=UPI000379C2AD|nr:FG-GAP repeat protein [Rudanella lutea]